MDSAISLRKTVSYKMGTSIKIPESGIDFAKSYFSQTAKTWELQNKIILASIDSLSKNFHAFNENTQSFVDIGSKIIKS